MYLIIVGAERKGYTVDLDVSARVVLTYQLMRHVQQITIITVVTQVKMRVKMGAMKTLKKMLISYRWR